MFRFGRNWKSFLKVVDEGRIVEAERSLREMLGRDRLDEATFVDVGCGSGLFSLAAARLGAKRVFSFDYDPDSVECSSEMKRTFLPESPQWEIRQGSALDQEFLKNLGEWDIVYSWGVLHHTGNMFQALANVVQLVRSEGLLFVSIYNDQGLASKVWKTIKRAYNANFILRALIVLLFVPYLFFGSVVLSILRLQNPFGIFRRYRKGRGMSRFHDWFDWLGGYPFEVASPEQIVDFYLTRGFALKRLKTCGGRLGCNEFVFRKEADRQPKESLA